MPATLRTRRAAALTLLLAFVLVASMFTFTPSAEAMTQRRAQKFHSAMNIVANQKGDPYRYGAAGPNAFDCSGLIYYSFRKAGFRNIPRTSDQLARFSDRIRRGRMTRGDFVFFYDGGGVYHVGVFGGWRNGHRFIIHAPYGDQRVHRARIWTNSWFPGTIR